MGPAERGGGAADVANTTHGQPDHRQSPECRAVAGDERRISAGNDRCDQYRRDDSKHGGRRRAGGIGDGVRLYLRSSR